VTQVPPGGPSTLEAVLFDIDGTLLNSDSLHLAVFQEILAEEGFDDGRQISEAFFMQRISGRQNAAICNDLFPAWSVADGVAFAARKEARFRAMASTRLPSLVTPGLRPFCAQLAAAGVRVAAVTNAPRENAELMLRAIGTIDGKPSLEWFDALIIGDECSRAKPHPEPYLAAMRCLGVPAERCLAFEDSPSGATAAVAAGVRTVGITSTQSAAMLHGAGCALTVANFEEDALLQEMSNWAAPS
jgi:HAD superfamily hydrolase (TIGR01509 family)